MQLVQCFQGIPAWIKTAAFVVLLLAFAGASDEANAQWVPKWLNVGDFQHRYQSGGAETESDEVGWHYPGIYPECYV